MAERDRTEDITQQITVPPEPGDRPGDRRAEERSIKEIADALRPQVQELVQRQVEMAKGELAPIGRQAGVAIGLLVVGAVFLLVFLIFFFLSSTFAMQAAGFPLWAAAGISTVVLLIIGGTLAGIGAGRLRSLDPKPYRTIAVAQRNVEWLKGQFRR